jgi:hypothetical protein
MNILFNRSYTVINVYQENILCIQVSQHLYSKLNLLSFNHLKILGV